MAIIGVLLILLVSIMSRGHRISEMANRAPVLKALQKMFAPLGLFKIGFNLKFCQLFALKILNYR